jgi:hypothetical protein
VHHRCSYSECAESATVATEGCEYCVAHFISACYKHLEGSSESRIGEASERNAKGQRDSLLEIVDKVTSLSLNSIAFTNRERGQLMDILLWTCDLLAKRT